MNLLFRMLCPLTWRKLHSWVTFSFQDFESQNAKGRTQGRGEVPSPRSFLPRVLPLPFWLSKSRELNIFRECSLRHVKEHSIRNNIFIFLSNQRIHFFRVTLLLKVFRVMRKGKWKTFKYLVFSWIFEKYEYKRLGVFKHELSIIIKD